MSERQIKIALNICTYKRREILIENLSLLKRSRFFDPQQEEWFGRLHIFVTDNAGDLNLPSEPFLHYIKNRNVGGSGGFQRGIEEIRALNENFTHVIFMDDDVRFENTTFYLLFDFLKTVDEINACRPVAGRMMCLDRPGIQYTAAEQWNGGNIAHVEYMRNVSKGDYCPGKVVYDADADYGGWWFCCFPMEFVRDNDVLPFFLHCDDVEYGLRCGQQPIIIEGVHVWHETFEKRITPLLRYYDTRNPMFVNSLYGLMPPMEQVMENWKSEISKYHLEQDWLSEYYLIAAMNDFLKGLRWLKKIDPEKYHKRLQKVKTCKWKNAIFWRIVLKRYHLFGAK